MWLPLAGCAAVTFPRFLLDSADSIQRVGLVWALGLTAWWCLPLLWFTATAHSAALWWAGSAAYVSFAAWSLAATYGNTHSTAGFGLFLVPIYLAGVAMAIVGTEQLLRTRRHQNG